MSGFWSAIEATIAAWCAAGAGLPASSVIWANQRQAYPVRPYATLKRGSLRDLGGPGGELDWTSVADLAVDPAAWTTSHTYVHLEERTNLGNIYTCTTAGAGATTGTGPSGTGTGITDGAAVWAYSRAATGWTATHAYVKGAERIKGENVYTCTTAGTSGTTGPTGTLDHIADGTCFWAYSRPAVGAGTRFSVTGRYEFIVSVQVFASATAGDAQATVTSTWERTAADYMHDARISLSKPSVIDALNAAGIAAIDATTIRDLPDDKVGTWMSRAQMDVTFSCTKTLTDTATTIDEVTGELALESADGSTDTIAFDVVLPAT